MQFGGKQADRDLLTIGEPESGLDVRGRDQLPAVTRLGYVEVSTGESPNAAMEPWSRPTRHVFQMKGPYNVAIHQACALGLRRSTRIRVLIAPRIWPRVSTPRASLSQSYMRLSPCLDGSRADDVFYE